MHSAAAQAHLEVRLPADRPGLSTEPYPSTLQAPARGAYHVVALMVEFEPRDSRFTTGDGTFDGDLFRGLEPVVDPFPHDADYFGARLRFLENYVWRVSGGRTQVTSTLIPEIVRLPDPMGAYSPTGPDAGDDAEMTKLARLVSDAWARAESAGLPDLTTRDPAELVFVIFHAGVGRDIELIGTTLDKTPEDIPSLYFGTSALTRLLGELPSAGGVTIDHSLVLPRTETRRGQNFITGESFLAEFSINGMLAATFFSRLGVPDLFNTETGASAIGPFGLMDALGIFAFNGLFPPEPSAWTKHYLGWADTRTVTGATPTDVSLRAASAQGPSDQIRVPISDAEYFLVENRYRGLDDGGVSLTVWRDGAHHEVRFDNQTDGFSRFDISGFPGGVVVDASNYDWALPGGLDEDGNELNGGVLIWHVDERIIREGLAANRVNVDPRRRGVSLREADGAQDIGFPSQGDFGPQTHLGTPFDFYFEGNPVRVVTRTGREIAFYTNRFGPDTVPSSHTTDGGASFVLIEDFSGPGPDVMLSVSRSAQAGLQADGVLSGQVLPTAAGSGSSVLSFSVEGRHHVFARSSPEDAGVLVAIDAETGEVETVADRVASRPAVTPNGDMVIVRDVDGSMAVHIGDRVVEIDATPSDVPPVVAGSAVYVADAGGRLWRIAEVDPECTLCEGAGRAAIAAAGSNAYFATERGLSVLDASGALVDEHPFDAPIEPASMLVVGGTAVVQDQTGEVMLMIAGSDRRRVDTGYRGTDGEEAFLFAANFGRQGRPHVFQAAGSVLVGYEMSGAVSDGFPLRLPARVSAQPIVYHDSEGALIVVPLEDGRLDGYRLRDGRVERAEPFPLSVGREMHATPALSDTRLIAVSADGVLSAYRIEGTVSPAYAEERGGPANTSYLGVVLEMPGVVGESSIIGSDTYNWPNPIRNGWTTIRATTTRHASVDIYIVDGAGQTVDRLEIAATRPGVPSEVRWEADAPSGIYFARVRARFDGGGEDVHIIKMAILR